MANHMQSSGDETPSQFERLLAAGASISPRLRKLELFTQQISSDAAMPGQIWSTLPSSNDSDESLTHWVFVLGRELLNESLILRVAPMFTDTVMADHQDAILPPDILGFDAAFALGLTVSTCSSVLNRCVLELPREWTTRLLGFERFVDGRSETRPSGLESGIPYVDQLDSRIAFHAELLAELDYLQQSLGHVLAEPKFVGSLEFIGNVVEVSFYGDLLRGREALAADSGTEAFIQTFEVPDLHLILDVEAHPKSAVVLFNISDAAGSPSLKLDGCEVCSGDGRSLGVIQGSSFALPVGAFFGSFVLMHEGKSVTLRSKQNESPAN
jgi:hypothetical protein